MKIGIVTVLSLLLGLDVLAEDVVWQRLETGTAAEVPGAFVYDPITKTSVKNEHSLALGGDAVTAPVSLAGSFTLEAFVKPTAEMEGAFVSQMSLSNQAPGLGLRLFHLRAHH